MRRYLLLSGVIGILLLLVVMIQRPGLAEFQGDLTPVAYFPVTSLYPTPTATPTATPEPVLGTGVFYNDLTSYHDYTGTMAWGFVRFYDGSPAFGGPNNYHVWVSFSCGGTFRSTDVDGTGYYSIPISGLPSPAIRCPGEAWLTVGPLGSEATVSNRAAFDTTAGSCWRMDWRECQAGDGSAACMLSAAGLQSPYELSVSTGPTDIAGSCPP